MLNHVCRAKHTAHRLVLLILVARVMSGRLATLSLVVHLHLPFCWHEAEKERQGGRGASANEDLGHYAWAI